MLSAILERLRDAEDLSFDEAKMLADAIFTTEDSNAAIAELLVALADKGETGSEIAGFASALLDRATPISAPAGAVDLCGTGGSGLSRFNISTAAAFAAAACGVSIAKHGNRGSRCANGSFDLLEALGIPIDLSPEASSRALSRTGMAFLYARQYHPAMKKVAVARKRVARRTVFNLVGPLANPANVGYQVIGTADTSRLDALAEAVRILGKTRVLIVRGEPGIDELSVSGETAIREVSQTGTDSFSVRPQDFEIPAVRYDMIPSGLAEANAQVFLDILETRAEASVIDMVALNAGAVLYVAGNANSIPDGFAAAKAAIGDGRMKAKFEEYSLFVKQLDAR